MTALQQEPFFTSSGLKLIENIILLIGALVAGLLTVWYILALIWGALQSYAIFPKNLNLPQLVTHYAIILLIFIIPASGAFSCVKALKSSQARWPAIASLSAAIIGGITMLVGFGVGWSYHPDTPKLPGILISIAASLLTALPFILIALSRVRKVK